MVKYIVQIVALFVVVNAFTEQEQWNSFKEKFSKSYEHALEERTRYSIFRDNLATIESHNQKYEAGLVSYKMGINQFADKTHSEFVSMLNLNTAKESLNGSRSTFEVPVGTKIPSKINWIDLGAVTPIKDQGSCGSCWSFSATGALEGQYFVQNNKLISLSEQNLVDCTSSYGDYGCEGGLMDYAFAYVRDVGIMTEKDYPYAGINEACQFDASKSAMKIKSFVDIRVGSETELKNAVATIGPISVAVDANDFMLYSSGIFDDTDCGNDRYSLNHGILAVGYGTEDGVDYWLVKNSWGPDWGEQGYIRMTRNKNNQCGIATLSSYPVV